MFKLPLIDSFTAKLLNILLFTQREEDRGRVHQILFLKQGVWIVYEDGQKDENNFLK